MNDAMTKLLCADDLALVVNGKQELRETLEEWNGLLTRHGLEINLDKIEVLHIIESRPPEGKTGHRAGGEETYSSGQFRVYL